MKASFVELPCFVSGTGHLVKVLAALGRVFLSRVP
jgi:hypothetical protein